MRFNDLGPSGSEGEGAIEFISLPSICNYSSLVRVIIYWLVHSIQCAGFPCIISHIFLYFYISRAAFEGIQGKYLVGT